MYIRREPESVNMNVVEYLEARQLPRRYVTIVKIRLVFVWRTHPAGHE